MHGKKQAQPTDVLWICRGEVLPGQMVTEPEAPKNPVNDRRRRNNRGGRNDRGNRNNRNNNTAKAEGAKAEGGN